MLLTGQAAWQPLTLAVFRVPLESYVLCKSALNLTQAWKEVSTLPHDERTSRGMETQSKLYAHHMSSHPLGCLGSSVGPSQARTRTHSPIEFTYLAKCYAQCEAQKE